MRKPLVTVMIWVLFSLGDQMYFLDGFSEKVLGEISWIHQGQQKRPVPHTLPETNLSSENPWLEDEIPLGPGLFSGAKMLVPGSVVCDEGLSEIFLLAFFHGRETSNFAWAKLESLKS